MSTTAVYYPRVDGICFYDTDGKIKSGMMGKQLTRAKFWSLLKSGKMPRISLRKKVKITL